MRVRVNTLRLGNILAITSPGDGEKDTGKGVKIHRISPCTHSRRGVGKVHFNQTDHKDGRANTGLCYDLIGYADIIVPRRGE